MFKKIADVLREVFWLKKKSRTSARKTAKKSTKKTVKKTTKKIVKKVSKPALKLVKPAKQAIIKPSKGSLDPALKPIGEITHYFDRIKVAVIKITQGTILIGDRLTIAASKGKFTQKVWSMQIESQDVKVAKKGQLIGIKVDKPVAAGDIVYK